MKVLAHHPMKGQKKAVHTHFLATGYIDNGFKDVQFRFSVSDVKGMGLPQLFSHTHRYLGERYYHNDLIIIPIEAYQYSSVPKGVPAEYLAMLNQNKNFVNPRIEPILGTVVFGRFVGLQFSLFGTQEIDRYFGRSSIQRVMRGERQFHRSCVFRHVTHREAIPYHGNLTQEVHDDLYLNKCLKKFRTSR